LNAFTEKFAKFGILTALIRNDQCCCNAHYESKVCSSWN